MVKKTTGDRPKQA